MKRNRVRTEKIIQVKLKPAPIIKMVGVTVIVALIIVFIDAAFRSLPNYEGFSWVEAHLVHIPQFLVPFLIIWYITKGKLREYGFNLKKIYHFLPINAC